MQNENLVTSTGKAPTISTGFRLPLPEYAVMLELCRRRGATISAATAELWRQELRREREEASRAVQDHSR